MQILKLKFFPGNVIIFSLLHSPLMLADRPVWLVLYSQFFVGLRTHLVIGDFSFSLFFIGHHTGIKFTGTDQTVWAVHSSNCWFYVDLKFGDF